MKIVIALSCLLAVASSARFNHFSRNQAFRPISHSRQLSRPQPQQFVPEPQHFAPQPQLQRSLQGPVVAILREESQGEGTPNFSYGFEADNGIAINTRGSQGSAGQANMEGSYSFTLPDGTVATVNWVADEGGFRAESPLLPVAPVNPHPMPAHALEQIRFAEEQRARGLRYDEFQGAWV